MSEYIYGTDDREGHWFTGEEIVRCKVCEFEMNGYCSRPDEWIKELWFPIEPDGFCAWAERRKQ
jgi:hypothetical protein